MTSRTSHGVAVLVVEKKRVANLAILDIYSLVILMSV